MGGHRHFLPQSHSFRNKNEAWFEVKEDQGTCLGIKVGKKFFEDLKDFEND